MKILGLAVLALGVVSGPVSSQSRIALVQPKDTPLVLARLQREQGLEAAYKGQVAVSGTLVAEWAESYPHPEFLLVPDQESVHRLPHFSHYQVRTIELVNGREALEMAMGGAAIDLLRHRNGNLELSGTFVIDGYIVGVECDAPWAKAKVVSARVPDKTLAAQMRPEGGC